MDNERRGNSGMGCIVVLILGVVVIAAMGGGVALEGGGNPYSGSAGYQGQSMYGRQEQFPDAWATKMEYTRQNQVPTIVPVHPGECQVWGAVQDNMSTVPYEQVVQYTDGEGRTRYEYINRAGQRFEVGPPAQPYGGCR